MPRSTWSTPASSSRRRPLPVTSSTAIPKCTRLGSPRHDVRGQRRKQSGRRLLPQGARHHPRPPSTIRSRVRRRVRRADRQTRPAGGQPSQLITAIAFRDGAQPAALIDLGRNLPNFPLQLLAKADIIRLIRKWLKAGVLEEGVVTVSEMGTAQGSVISPLLANIYMHYVFDLWAHRWRRREAQGDVVIVRYADDFVV